MKFLNTLDDKKINAQNHLVEISLYEYAQIAKKIINNNQLQRRKVISSNRVYVLLKDDLKMGCVIPPLVLAFFPKEDQVIKELSKEDIIDKLTEASDELIILDGLQRSFTIIDLLDELKDDPHTLEKVKKVPLRMVVYSGISKVGVLYRMLTLNTGQTPMSTRHQVEILYSDYKDGVEGLKFITEAENKTPSGDKEFRFNDILDGFLSYITGDYLPLGREDLISIIKNLEILTKDDKQKDIFKLFVKTYDSFRQKIVNDAKGWNYNRDEYLDKRPFAKNVNEIFSKVQMLAGFGAALSFLIDNSLISSLEEAIEVIQKIRPNGISACLD